jgi:hypothetical protein
VAGADEPSVPRGQCLCGAVTFTVRGELRDVVNCHCLRCRRWTGHHMAATSTAAADLVVEDRTAALAWFSPVPEASYGFCRTCGSSLFWRATGSASTSICAGVLDAPTGLRTTEAWWVAEASDYYQRPDLPEHDFEP